MNVAVLANDSDASGDRLSIVSVTPPAHGAASIDGTSIRYLPAAGFVGVDVFEYTTTDGAEFDTAAVTVDVQSSNTAPTAVLAIAPGIVQAGSPTTLDFRSSFDPDPADAVASYVVTLTAAPLGSSGGGGGGQQFAVGVPFDTSLATLTFVPDVAGAYRFQLFVRDTRLASSGVVAADLQVTQPPPPGTVARVTINRTTVFLTGVGQTAALNATAVDEQGTPVSAVVTWSSSRSDQVSVDASGRVLAEAIGSALIVAEANGIRSAPAFAVVAEPAPGALLVTDAQVVAVSPPLSVPPDTAPGVGTLYEVTLTGVASPPVPGTVMLAAGEAPVAGKVVGTRQEGATQIVTLELAPLYELLSQYRIDWAIDLKQFPLVAVPAGGSIRVANAAGMGARHGRTDWGRLAALADAPVIEPFKAFECDGKAEASLVSREISLTPTVDLQLIVQDSPGHSKHVLTGSESLIGKVGIKLKANISASGTCLAKTKFDIPIGGWVSVLVMPAVRLGLGVKLEGKLVVAEGEISATGKVGSTQTLGWECGGAPPVCRALDDIKLLDEFKFKAEAPSLNGMHVEASGHFFVLLGLDLVFVGTEDFQILDARIGPKQSFDLGREVDQAENRSYASKYRPQAGGCGRARLRSQGSDQEGHQR